MMIFPTSSILETTRIHISPNTRDQIEFLNEHISLRQILHAIKDRFKAIRKLLKQVVMNRHDLDHMLRTMKIATGIMRNLGFNHEELLIIAIATLLHDFGYIHEDEPEPGDRETPLHDTGGRGEQAAFKKHARYGAEEVSALVKGLWTFLEIEKKFDIANHTFTKEEVEKLRSHPNTYLIPLFLYKEKDSGTWRFFDIEKIELLYLAILHHNDYGKDMADYNPATLKNKIVLATQFADKIDHIFSRPNKEHLEGEQNQKRIKERTGSYYHKTVPYCGITYHVDLIPEERRVEVSYSIDLGRISKKVPGFSYTPEEYLREFKKAYGNSMELAAESMNHLFADGEEVPQNELVAHFLFVENGEVVATKSEAFTPKRRAGL